MQGDYHLTDRLTATLGARYTVEKRDFNVQGVYDNFSGVPLPVTPGAPTTTALPYDQERVTAYEIGLRTDGSDHRLRANGTAFYNQYDGLRETAAVISPVTKGFVSVRSNAHRAHTEGFELETAYQPISDLSLTANASYLETRPRRHCAPRRRGAMSNP